METLITTKEQKWKAVDVALAAINKEHGEGSISKLGSKKILPVDVYSTRVYGIDKEVCGVGGIPRGRITEILGPESAGKTTVALQVVAEAQSKGDIAAYVDAEHALDLGYAKKLGVDTANLLLSQPDSGEEALSIVEHLIKSGGVGIVVVDSVAALTPKAELDGEMEDQQMGLQARLMSKAMRKLKGVTNQNNVALVFINQIREKIGVMFGPTETTPGGRALRFYASLRLDVRKVGTVKDGDGLAESNTTKVKAVKNKVAPPFRETEVPIVFGQGMDGIANLLSYAEGAGVVERAGAWYSHKGERIGQGKDNVIEYLRSNPKVYAQIVVETDKARAALKELEA